MGIMLALWLSVYPRKLAQFTLIGAQDWKTPNVQCRSYTHHKRLML
jgi:hypothetical protein